MPDLFLSALLRRGAFTAAHGALATGGSDSNAVQSIGVVTGLASCNRHTLTLTSGATAYVDECLPSAAWNGKAFLLFPGHSISIVSSGTAGASMLQMLQDLLAAGYRVWGPPMPVTSPNPVPLAVTLNGSPFSFVSHDDMARGMATPYSIFDLFLEPAVRAVNQIRTSYGAATKVMATGISGGGWGAGWLGAIDERIAASYPVMSGMPRSWCNISGFNSGPDFEQGESWGLRWEDRIALCGTLGRRVLACMGLNDPVFGTANIPALFEGLRTTLRAQVGTNLNFYIDQTASTHEYTSNVRSQIITDAATV